MRIKTKIPIDSPNETTKAKEKTHKKKNGKNEKKWVGFTFILLKMKIISYHFNFALWCFKFNAFNSLFSLYFQTLQKFYKLILYKKKKKFEISFNVIWNVTLTWFKNVYKHILISC